MALELINSLSENNITHKHSPLNPASGTDPLWKNWYSSELENQLKQCNTFIIVVDQGWESSTWMATEAETAKLLNLSFAYWNPLNITKISLGMQSYLKNQLPINLSDATVKIAEYATL